MLKIGKLVLKTNVILAPLAGVSDYPFRMINRKFGCELAFTEMISSNALKNNNKTTYKKLAMDSADMPIGIQLLGTNEENLLRSVEVINNYKFALIDYNAACPVRKVVARGEGSGLLKDPPKLNKLLKIIVKNSRLPVTVKIRSGWSSKTINAVETALQAEDAGIDGIFIHGRTKEQAYSGTVDYRSIESVKKAVKIPVIASGDNLSVKLIKNMFNETGCDGAVIARGAFGNPWIFTELNSSNNFIKPSKEEISEVMLEHYNMCLNYYGEQRAVKIFKKHVNWYTRGYSNSRIIRNSISRIKTQDDMHNIIELFFLDT